MVGYNGQAHSSSIPDPDRLSNRIQNGPGMATGADRCRREYDEAVSELIELLTGS